MRFRTDRRGAVEFCSPTDGNEEVDTAVALHEVPTIPADAERVLASLLRGRQLVYEIGVEPENALPLVSLLASALGEVNHSYRRIAVRFPAILISAVVADSISAYRAGSLWDNLRIPRAPSSEIGKAFEEAIQRLRLARLEVFDELRATRFVSRIVAHGGIPENCVDDLRRLVSHFRRGGAETAEEALPLMRGSRLEYLNLDRPVRRFLRDTGAVGRDFLDRVLYLPEELGSGESDQQLARRVGLPRHVITAFRRGRAEIHVRSRRGRVKRPVLVFDPDVMLSPELILVSGEPVVARWSVRHLGGETVERRELPTAGAGEIRIAVAPAETWSVEAMAADGQVLRSFEIPGPDERVPLMAFDVMDGHQVADIRACTAAEIWVLSPCALAPAGSGLTLGAMFVLEAGPWTGWYAHDIVVGPEGGVLIGALVHETISVRISRAPNESIELLNIVPGVSGSDGLPVIDGPPTLSAVPWSPEDADRWQLSVSVDGGPSTSEQAPSDLAATLVVLRRLLPNSCARATLRLIGPMGTGSAREFAIARGLRTSIPARALLPGEEVVVLVVSEALGDGNSLQVNLSFRAPAATVSIPLAEGRALTVSLRVRALRWRLLDFDDPVTSFTSTPVDLLLLGSRQPSRLQFIDVDEGVGLRVAINGEQATLVHGLRGRGSRRAPYVELSGLVERLRSGAETEIVLDGIVGGSKFRIAQVREPVETVIQDLQVLSGGADCVSIRVATNKPLAQACVRITSLERPWRPALDLPVPLGGGEILVELGTLTNGRHRAVVGLLDAVRFAPSPSTRSSEIFVVPDESCLKVSVEVDPREGVLLLSEGRAVELPVELVEAVAPVVVMVLARAGQKQGTIERLLTAVPLNEAGWNQAIERSATECDLTHGQRIAASIRIASRCGRRLTKLHDFGLLPADVLAEIVKRYRFTYADQDLDLDSRSARTIWLIARHEYGWLFGEQVPAVVGAEVPLAGGVGSVLGSPVSKLALARMKDDLRQTLQSKMLPLSANCRFTALVMLHLLVQSSDDAALVERFDDAATHILGAPRDALSKRLHADCAAAEKTVILRRSELSPLEKVADRLRLSTLVAAAHLCSRSEIREIAADFLADVALVLPHLAEMRIAYAAALALADSRTSPAELSAPSR